MGLNGALQIGRSAILSSQAAMNIAGNNMANAATPGYHRQIARLSPSNPGAIGRNQFVGTGVQLVSVNRAIDTALQMRLRAAISDQNAAEIDYRFMSAIETLQNELTGDDLSSRLSAFFNAFSELGNNPTDHALRTVVLQQGSSLTGHINSLRDEYTVIRQEVDRSLGVNVQQVDGLLNEIAAINTQISMAEGGAGGEASSLRDQRDQIIDDLSQYLEVTTVEQANGSVDVLVNSIPIVLAGESRGLELRTESGPNGSEVSIRVGADGTTLDIRTGTIGALVRQREDSIAPAIDALDEFSSQLIFQVNNLHAQGVGTSGRQSILGLTQVTDPSANLNADGSGIPWKMTNGTFQVHVVDSETGERMTHQVQVDPENMSLEDLVNEINTVLDIPNLTASIDSSGQLSMAADNGFEVSFSEDESGVLAALGMNAFFGGSDASDIVIDQVLLDDPSLLAASADFTSGGNGIALQMVGLQDLALEDLGGASLRQFWQSAVNDQAVRTGAAANTLQSSRLVKDSLEAQNASVSGVSIDEEAIDLMTLQRQFQAAARFVSVIDETMDVLMGIV